MDAATMYTRQAPLLQLRTVRAALKYLADRIASGFVWWMEGLWIGLPEPLRSALFQHRDRLIVRIQGSEATIERYTENRLQLAQDDAEVTVLLPPGSALTKRLAVPLSAESELRNVLFHELDRLTPLPIEEFAFDYHVVQRDREAGKLCVELALVRASSLQATIAAVRRLGLEPSVVTVAGPGGTALALNLLPGRRRRRLPAVRLPFKPAAAGGALLMLLLALYLPLGRYENLLDAHELRADAQREHALAARAALADGEKVLERAEYLSRRRLGYVAPVDVLLALTQEIPDHTWLSRLSIGVDGVQLQGETTQASAVLEIVESVDQLEDAQFQSPVARSNVAGKERFSIVASLGESEQ